MRLTAQTIARYRPPQDKADHIVFDEDLSGFGLRYRAGRRTWVFQYAFGTGPERVNARMTLGEYPALSAAKARDTAQDLYAKVRLGQHPAADKQKSRAEARHTFGRLVEGYLTFQRSELRDSSYAEIARYLDRYAKSLHGLPAAVVDRKKIADFVDTVAKEHGPVSANRARASLSALFSWSMRRGLHDSNPVVGTEQRKEKTRDRVLSDSELAAIWGALDDGDYCHIIRLLILTGQRANEIADLRWSEINFDENLISLPAERCKNGRAHQFPMSKTVADILGVRRKTLREYVFGNRNGNSGFNGWGKCKDRLDARIADCSGAPLPNWVVHDLRRTFATGLQRLGVRLEVTEAILNHVSGSRGGVTGIYQRHNWAEEKKTALDAWAAHVLAVVSGKKDKSNVMPIRGRA
jgi:integrase